MPENPLKKLLRLGQSPWLDMISRSLLASGELKRMIAKEALSGVTSNPTIFEKAIAESADYDDSIRALTERGERDSRKIFEELAVRDIRDAADLLAPVHDRTRGADGFVSLEVSPELAYDAEATVREAEHLFKRVDRKNVMIKVPGTPEGLTAVERLISQGVNVNVTLIFSIERYEAVMQAYLAGLERLSQSGRGLSEVASVASFFVSRIDTAVDKLIQEKNGPKSLLGKTAIANAKLAYQRFKKTFSSRRFAALKKKGARVQRPLWASTSTKNPAYRDVLYLEELIGTDTVNTIPPATWKAFLDHGKPRLTLEKGVAEARRNLRELADAGVSLAQVTERLESEGVKAFADSFTGLIKVLAEKIERLCPPVAA